MLLGWRTRARARVGLDAPSKLIAERRRIIVYAHLLLLYIFLELLIYSSSAVN